MNARGRILVVAALVAAVALVLAFKRGSTGSPRPELAEGRSGGTTDARPTGSPTASQAAEAALPRLVDLGANTCIPCKMMAPILEELSSEYEGRLRVDVIDVRENPDAARQTGIRVIPTQIFYDASGKELSRHEGFMSKEDILATWKELGIDLSGSAR